MAKKWLLSIIDKGYILRLSAFRNKVQLQKYNNCELYLLSYSIDSITK